MIIVISKQFIICWRCVQLTGIVRSCVKLCGHTKLRCLVILPLPLVRVTVYWLWYIWIYLYCGSVKISVVCGNTLESLTFAVINTSS